MFGKKPKPLEARPPIATGARIIPEELFDTNTDVGRMLKEIGISPDDPEFRLMTDKDAKEYVERQRSEMLAFIDQINGNLPDGVNVAPLCMVPERVWNSVHGGFLLNVLQITPYGAWNMLPLPRDQHSAKVLNLSMCEPPPGDKFIEGLVEHIGTFVREIKQVSDEIAAAMAAGKPPRFERSVEIHDEIRRKMRGVGFYIAGQMVGGETLLRSREMFFGEKFDPQPARMN